MPPWREGTQQPAVGSTVLVTYGTISIVSPFAVILLLIALTGSIWVAYAITRYGLIPALRTLERNDLFREMWQRGGWVCRLSLFGTVVAVLIGGLAVLLFINDFVWQGAVLYVVAMTLAVVCNLAQRRAVKAHTQHSR